MPLQIGVGEVKYAPARDIAYLYPSVLSNVADRLEAEAFKPLHEMLLREGVTMDDLGAACEAYALFTNMAHQTDKPMAQAMEESGWLAVHPLARVAYMFYVGAMIGGTFYTGIRDACPKDEHPSVLTLTKLVKDAKAFVAYTSAPAWMRSFIRRFRWFRCLFYRVHDTVEAK